jgi:hypothetical protein
MSSEPATGFQAHSGYNQPVNLQPFQTGTVAKGTTHLWQRIPSQSQAQFGGYFSVIIRNLKDCQVDELVLEFDVGALTGLTVTNSGTAALQTCFAWFQRIDICLGSVTIDSLFPWQNFALFQAFAGSDEKRLYLNLGAGQYSSHANRATKSAAQGRWYLPLMTVFNSSSLPLLSGLPDLELKIYLSPLSDLVTLTSGSTSTGTRRARSTRAL